MDFLTVDQGPMTRRMWVHIVWSVVGLVLFCGCDSATSAKPTTAAEQFVSDQEGIVTPHGPIDTSSVTESNGTVGYETPGGKFEVDYVKNTDGGFTRSSEPRRTGVK